MSERTRFTIGQDATAFGRWVRLVSGLLLIAYPILRMISSTDRVAAIPVLGYFVGILVVYYGGYLLLEKPLLARMNPWLNALVFVVPSLVIVFVPLFPAALRIAMILYWGVMSILNSVIHYGGCEVIAIPTLIHKRRYDVYCPTNVLDAAEQVITTRHDSLPQPERPDR